MDASYKIQRGIHVHLIQFFMCPEFWVHIIMGYGTVFCVKMGQARWPWNVMVREKTGFE